MAIINEWVRNMSDVMWTTQRDEYKIKLLVLAQRNETECIDTTKSPADTHHFKILPILSDILCQTKISCKDIKIGAYF